MYEMKLTQNSDSLETQLECNVTLFIIQGHFLLLFNCMQSNHSGLISFRRKMIFTKK